MKPHEHEQFKKTWNIEMPRGEEVYCKEHTDFFYANRNTFVVYAADEDVNYKFTYEKSPQMEEKVGEIARRLEVEYSEMPDFSQDYWWNQKSYKYGSNLTILYFPSESKYYFVEEYINSNR